MPDSGRAGLREKRGNGTQGRSTSESLSRAQWIEAAWELLGEGSVDRVRVEPLAKKLGVTKGSFYWHFKDRQELVDALLDRWFSIWDDDADPSSSAAADPADRIWDLFERVIRRVSRGQTVSLRLWSHHDPAVARRIEARDKERLTFLVDQFVELGFDREDAVVRGQLYQALMSGEFLRSGGLPLAERLERAREQHSFLVGIAPQ